MQEKISYGGWPNCIRLANNELEIIATTDIGPRIVRLGFIGGRNFFYLSPDEKGKTGGPEWRIYGGHRLWVSPEVMERTYCPDNVPVAYSGDDYSVVLTAPKETTTGLVKEMAVALSPEKNRVMITHRLINYNLWDIELSAWAISAMSGGGRAIVPQEPFHDGSDHLLPVRAMALWCYTTMNDARWIWGDRYIRAVHDSRIKSEQKIGLLNTPGWVAYSLDDELLIKQFTCDPARVYPDFNSNNEIYMNKDFLEIETLGPVTKVPPGGVVEHVEHWSLFKCAVGESEESITADLLPLLPVNGL